MDRQLIAFKMVRQFWYRKMHKKPNRISLQTQVCITHRWKLFIPLILSSHQLFGLVQFLCPCCRLYSISSSRSVLICGTAISVETFKLWNLTLDQPNYLNFPVTSPPLNPNTFCIVIFFPMTQNPLFFHSRLRISFLRKGKIRKTLLVLTSYEYHWKVFEEKKNLIGVRLKRGGSDFFLITEFHSGCFWI